MSGTECTKALQAHLRSIFFFFLGKNGTGQGEKRGGKKRLGKSGEEEEGTK